MNPNPILNELQNLSPSAQQALIQAHQIAAPTTAGQSGGPAIQATMAHQQPTAPAAITHPAMTSEVPSIGNGQAPGKWAGPAIQHTIFANEAAKMQPQAPTLMAGSSAHVSGPQSESPSTLMGMGGSSPTIAPSSAPNVIQAKRGTTQGDQDDLSRVVGSGSGISQIGHKIEGLMPNHPILGKILGIGAQGLATLGNVGLDAVAPAVSAALPGTDYAHDRLVKQDQQQVAGDEANAEKQAQTSNLNLQPKLHAAQAALAQEKQNDTENYHQAQTAGKQGTLNATLAAHGYAADEDNPGQLRPLRYEEMSEQQQAVHDLKGSQDELAQASSALKKSQNDPSSPAYRLAEQRILNAQATRNIAAQRLGLSESQFEMRSRGTQGGVALPGSMIDDQGQPVGTAFQQNVRPTGTERNKADMASSASEQLGDIKSIIQKHPDLFGPGYGQATAFTKWIGSQDPDAQRFLAARTIAGDHLAGTFGGRSETALTALDNAIGQFKDNPKAALAGIDQLTKANSRFQTAGTVRTTGSNAAPTSQDGPKAGEVENGYRFKGGDPSKQSNWEKQ